MSGKRINVCLSVKYVVSSIEQWLSSWMNQLASHWRKVNEFPVCADFPFVSLPWHTEGIFNCALAVLQGQVDLMAFQSASICPEELWIHVAYCWVLIKSVDFAQRTIEAEPGLLYSWRVTVWLSLPCLSPCVVLFQGVEAYFCILKAQVVDEISVILLRSIC